MSLKIVFLFALVAVAYGLPSAEPKSDSKALDEIPAQVDTYLEQLFSADVAPVAEIQDSEGVLTREKRACRTIQFRSRSGRLITAKKC